MGARGRRAMPSAGNDDGPTLNGFRTRPEPEALRISPDSVAPFSLPQEALDFVPDAATVFTRFKNGDCQRQIHCNVGLQPSEEVELRALQDEAAAKGVRLLPSVAGQATRYLSYARGDPKRALALMQRTQEWRLSYFADGPVTDEDVAPGLRHGFIYFAGRDQCLRPTLVVRASRVPLSWQKERRSDKIIRVLVFCMEYFLRFMVVPGKVESLSVIVDLSGLSLSQVPLQQLKEVYAVMSRHYIIRVYRFYVCNVPSMLNMIMGVARGILSDRQQQKLVMVRRVAELRQDFALHHLETDLGGTRPIIKDFFPFPLLPGPFSAGHSQGPSKQAVPGLHEALAARDDPSALDAPAASAAAASAEAAAPHRASSAASASAGLPALATGARGENAQGRTGCGEEEASAPGGAARALSSAAGTPSTGSALPRTGSGPTVTRPSVQKLGQSSTINSEQETDAGSDQCPSLADCSSQEGDSAGKPLHDMDPDEMPELRGTEIQAAEVAAAPSGVMGFLLGCGLCQVSHCRRL